MAASVSRNYLQGALIAVVIFTAAGCGTGLNLKGLEGDVTFNGNVIDDGTIEFIPLDDTGGGIAGSAIQKGHYEVPAQHGVRAGGTYKVAIVSVKKTGRMLSGLDPTGLVAEYANIIPPDYNGASTLKITVPKSGSVPRFDFHLPITGN